MGLSSPKQNQESRQVKFSHYHPKFNKNNFYYYSSYFGEKFSKSSGLNSRQRFVVDKENQTVKLNNDIYTYYDNGLTIYQEKIEDGMISTYIDGMNLDTLVQNQLIIVVWI